LSPHSDGTEGLERPDESALIDDVKVEWKMLWHSRIDDKVRAEGIANKDYSLLFVERGTVIVATRDFKPLNLKEILCSHKILNVERVVSPHPSIGGWGKFARTVLNKQRRVRKWEKPLPRRNSKKKLQLKKGGRGWLHIRMER
jgi:hypothetical protein